MVKIAPQKLWQLIDNAIVKKLVSSAFEETPRQFLPEGELNQILQEFSSQFSSRHEIIFVLLQLRASPTTDEKRSLVDYILDKRSPALRLFFTLLRAKHDYPFEAMMLFMRKPIRDADLPLHWSTPEDFRKYLALTKEEWDEDIWTISSVTDFQNTQLLFLAPVLTTDITKMPGQFGQNTLPFIQKDPVIAKGGFCVVSRYTIHPKHLDMKGKPNTGQVVAVKELNKDGSDVARHWAREASALQRMEFLNKENIIRFITAFTRGRAEDGPSHLKHYLVFEWADGGNLRKLWEHYPRPGRPIAFTKWVMEQLYGLSQALGAIHYLLNDKGQYAGASYRHGDIKPENILWFRSEGKGEGTLKICDWGEAKNHDDITQHRPLATTALYGTRRYEPPETVDASVLPGAIGARSRLYDIWSMGCVMLECVIWLVYGLDEHKRFNKDNRGDYGVSDNFYETHGDESLMRTVVHGAVNRWVAHMRNEASSQPGKTAIGDALEIVSEGLLVIKIPQGDLKPEEVDLFRCTHPMAAAPRTLTVVVPAGMNATEKHLPNKAVAVQHTRVNDPRTHKVTKGIQVPATRYESLQTGSGSSSPEISITPAEGPNTSMKKQKHPHEPQRYRATELADRLGKLVTSHHDDNYWLASGSWAKVPIPKATTASFLSPNSRGRPLVSNEGNAAAKQKGKGSAV